jgi:hypothetical protein
VGSYTITFTPDDASNATAMVRVDLGVAGARITELTVRAGSGDGLVPGELPGFDLGRLMRAIAPAGPTAPAFELSATSALAPGDIAADAAQAMPYAVAAPSAPYAAQAAPDDAVAAPVGKTAAKRTLTRNTPTRNTATKSTAAKSTAAKSTATKSTAADNIAAESTAAESTAAESTVAKSAAAKRAAAKQAPAKQVAAKKATAKATAKATPGTGRGRKATSGSTPGAPARGTKRTGAGARTTAVGPGQDTGRAYRRTPADIVEVFNQAPSATALAGHYGVPRHTVQGWLRRLRSEGVLPQSSRAGV